MPEVLLLAGLVAVGGVGLYLYWQNRTSGPPLIQYLLDGVIVVDAVGTVQQANPQFAAQTGIQDAVGLPYRDVLNMLTAAGESSGAAGEVSVDGRTLQPVESAITDARGLVTGKIVVFRDVTRYHNAIFDLEKRLERLSSLRRVHDEISESIDAESVPLFALDAAHRLSGAQAGFLALRDETGEMQAVALIGPYDREQIDDVLHREVGILGRVLREHEAERVLDVKNDPDYNIVLSQTNALMIVPLLGNEDELVGLISLATPFPERFTDDTFQLIRVLSNRIAASLENANLYQQTQQQLAELQQRHEQISQLEQLKTDMIRLAAHDLRNPVTDISLRLQILEMSLDDAEALQRSINAAKEATDRMSKLISDILSLERIEQIAKGVMENPDVINLYAEVSLVVDALQGAAQRKSIEMTFEATDRHTATVLGEQTQLHEAVNNLVSNAIKYTPDGGTVNVLLTSEDDQLVFQVKDTGYGIPDNMQERLFQPFFRARTKETRHVEGTGLGLHLVKRIIERHHGEMVFHSEYGKGSTFGFRLPVSTNEQNEAASTPVV